MNMQANTKTATQENGTKSFKRSLDPKCFDADSTVE